MFTKVREWLERNKIFFEILVALSLTTMSIFISYNANQIAIYQNNLIKEENQPIFVFNVTHFNDNVNNSSDVEERLDIYNIGKPAYNCSAKPYVFFTIQLYDCSLNLKNNAIIPVVVFYEGSMSTGSPTGLMKSFCKYNYWNIDGVY